MNNYTFLYFDVIKLTNFVDAMCMYPEMFDVIMTITRILKCVIFVNIYFFMSHIFYSNVPVSFLLQLCHSMCHFCMCDLDNQAKCFSG